MNIVIYNLSGFSEYLLFIFRMDSSEYELFKTGNFITDIYNALHTIPVFLTDVSETTYVRKRLRRSWIQDLNMDKMVLLKAKLPETGLR